MLNFLSLLNCSIIQATRIFLLLLLFVAYCFTFPFPFIIRRPQRERGVLPGPGQSRCRPDGGPEEEEEDHLQPSPAVRAGAGLRCDPVPGHHPEGEAGCSHTPAREQDTGEPAAQGETLLTWNSFSLTLCRETIV